MQLNETVNNLLIYSQVSVRCSSLVQSL